MVSGASGCLLIGTGVDLVENDRMKDVLARWDKRFRNRVFTKMEQEYCENKPASHRHYAGRFAVKESVSKAFGTGFGPKVGLLDIEVIRNEETGAPTVRFSERLSKFVESLGADEVLVSLSHTKHYAVAHAMLVRRIDGLS